MMGEFGAMPPPRMCIKKLVGRGGAKEELRRRFFERVREGRAQFLSKQRAMASEDDGGMCWESGQGELCRLARGVLRAEAEGQRVGAGKGALRCASEWQDGGVQKREGEGRCGFCGMDDCEDEGMAGGRLVRQGDGGWKEPPEDGGAAMREDEFMMDVGNAEVDVELTVRAVRRIMRDAADSAQYIADYMTKVEPTWKVSGEASSMGGGKEGDEAVEVGSLTLVRLETSSNRVTLKTPFEMMLEMLYGHESSWNN